MMVVMEAALQPARGRPRQRRCMKGETVHAVFAQIEQQRSQQDRDGCKGKDASHHAGDERGNAAMAKKHEKHPRLSAGIRRVGHPPAAAYCSGRGRRETRYQSGHVIASLWKPRDRAVDLKLRPDGQIGFVLHF
jgi:hypothetical protein